MPMRLPRILHRAAHHRAAGQEAKHRQHRQTLAGAGLADKAEDLAAVDLKVDIANRQYVAVPLAQRNLQAADV
jgi:hypothetical protein